MKNLPDRTNHGKSPDPFPVESLKRVDRPTTLIEDHEVSPVDELEGGFNRAGRGDFGPFLQKEYRRFVKKGSATPAASRSAKCRSCGSVISKAFFLQAFKGY